MAERFYNNVVPECTRLRSCYCWSCCVDRLTLHNEKPVVILEVDLEESCFRESQSRLAAFAEVLDQVAISKAYKMKVKEQFHYTKIACYFKTVLGLTRDEAAKKAYKINRNASVYDNFHKILDNLSECNLIDITGLSAKQLCQARNKAWCFTYNEMQRGRSNRPAELSYEEADYQDLLQTIKNHPVLHSIDRSVENGYGMRDISALSLRIGRELQGNR